MINVRPNPLLRHHHHNPRSPSTQRKKLQPLYSIQPPRREDEVRDQLNRKTEGPQEVVPEPSSDEVGGDEILSRLIYPRLM